MPSVQEASTRAVVGLCAIVAGSVFSCSTEPGPRATPNRGDSSITSPGDGGSPGMPGSHGPEGGVTTIDASAPPPDGGPVATGDGGTAPGSDASPVDDGAVAPLAAGAITCAPSMIGAAPPDGTNAIEVDTLGTPGEDGSRMYPLASPIQMTFVTRASSSDTVTWSLADAWQNVLATGQFGVPGSPATTTVTCTSTLAGYVAIAASLGSGATLPQAGTRRAGLATFGVLPDLSAVLPAVSYPHLDDHRFGMQGSNYINPNDPFNPICKNIGVTWMNMGRSWANLEPNGPNTFDPTTFQQTGAETDTTFGMDNLVPYVDLNEFPGWANSSGTTSASYPPSSFSVYQDFLTRVGQERALNMGLHPTMTKNYYQVTWEPDPGTGDAWQGTDDDFVSLYQAAYDGLHAGDPNAVVMGLTGSSISANDQMLTRMLAAGIGPYLDGLSYHGYYDAGCNWDHPPEDTSWGTEVPAQMRELRHILATNLKPHARLLQGELGIMYEINAEYGPDYPSLTQLAEHGEVVARANLMELGEGADVSYFFYASDAPEVGYGLSFDLDYDINNPATLWGTGDISPKPAAMMAAALTRLVDGTTTLGYLDGLPAGVYGYAFERLGGGPVVTAMWTHADGWNGNATYALAVGGTASQVVVVDAMGNPSAAPVLGGQVTLSLGEAPVYVISTDAATMKANVTVPEGYDPQL